MESSLSEKWTLGKEQPERIGKNLPEEGQVD
jgi:hypothetical protein